MLDILKILQATKTLTPRMAAPLLGAALMLLQAETGSARPRPVSFALVVGTNASPSPELKALRYADDDAARYFDLFRVLGANVRLLMRPDTNTRRLHHQAAAEAQPPTRQELDRAVDEVVRDVRRTVKRGHRVHLLVVYAGHGGIDAGRGYITLEDDRIDGSYWHERLVARLPGGRGAEDDIDGLPPVNVHFIIDACNSFYLAYARGPGGERKKASGFSHFGPIAQHDHVGLLLSASGAQESHEWDALQSGIFSHEVRSALYGAGDADGDGVVTYREISAFVTRANESIKNEKYRPRIVSRPPRVGLRGVADLRHALGRGIEVPAAIAGHHYIETSDGVRVAEFHKDSRSALRLVYPGAAGPLYLRQADHEVEYLIPPPRPIARVEPGTARKPTSARRGAAHDAFSLLFARPFGDSYLRGYRLPPVRLHWTPPDPTSSARHGWGMGLAALGVAAGGAGGYFAWQAAQQGAVDADSLDHRQITGRNRRITQNNSAALLLIGLGASVASAGVALWLWPETTEEAVDRPVRGAALRPSVGLARTPRGTILPLLSVGGGF